MDKKLLTPGPLTTSSKTKEVMLHDWGSRDIVFIELNKNVPFLFSPPPLPFFRI